MFVDRRLYILRICLLKPHVPSVKEKVVEILKKKSTNEEEEEES